LACSVLLEKEPNPVLKQALPTSEVGFASPGKTSSSLLKIVQVHSSTDRHNYTDILKRPGSRNENP